MEYSALQREWTRIIAPVTGDVRTELVREAAEFLGIPVDDAWSRLDGAGDRFRQEWLGSMTDARDADAVVEFYNRSNTELFELIEWHASDPIHYRTLLLRDLALRHDGREYLDYGSGIGNDALVFGDAGFTITVADVSDCLLAFAAWRARRRGFRVSTIDLKRERPAADRFDIVVCFDVLEHIPQPLEIVRALRASMREGALLAYHAPFGDDSEHPMHVVHTDVVTPRMRSLGFQPTECAFPPMVRAPHVFEKRRVSAVERAGYFVYDNYLQNSLGATVAALYRRTVRRVLVQS